MNPASLAQSLPRRVFVVGSINWYMKASEALAAIEARRAREVRSDSGELIGIELGHFGPRPSRSFFLPLPPSELPDTVFRPPSDARTHFRKCRVLIRMTRPFWRWAQTTPVHCSQPSA